MQYFNRPTPDGSKKQTMTKGEDSLFMESGKDSLFNGTKFLKIISKSHFLFVFCIIQFGIFPVLPAQSSEYSEKKCLRIINSYTRKLVNAQNNGDQETHSDLLAKSTRFYLRHPECADVLNELAGPRSSPTRTYTPT